MNIKKISATEWQVNMSDDEVATYVNIRIEMMLKINRLMKKDCKEVTAGEMLIMLSLAQRLNSAEPVIEYLRKYEPLLMGLIMEQSKDSSPESISAKNIKIMTFKELLDLIQSKIKNKETNPPNESDNFPA